MKVSRLTITFFGYLFLTSILFADSKIASHLLIEAAKNRLNQTLFYDAHYQKLAYPMGDVENNRGVCSDLIIRSYRALGIDLQKRIHEDMQAHFAHYPNYWGLKYPDKNIDHRRVPNLQTFFKRYGKILKITKDPKNYQGGDLVTWLVDGRFPHIGIVINQYSKDGNRPLIIHNIGRGVEIQDMLFEYPITGHYRYFP